LAAAFDSTHPLPQVRDLQSEEVLHSLFSFNYVLLTLCTLHSLSNHQSLASCPHLPEEGPINAEVAPADSEAPEACENQDGDEAKDSLEGSDSTLSSLLAESEAHGAEKKKKRMEDLTSSGTSNPKDVPWEQTTSRDSVPAMFELLDS
jgi:hypothetical protein